MNRQQTLMPLPLAAEMIAAGQVLCIAGDEAVLRQLPRGQWIGGTIPYFMTGDGGQVSRDQVFVTPVTGFAEPPARFSSPPSLASPSRPGCACATAPPCPASAAMRRKAATAS